MCTLQHEGRKKKKKKWDSFFGDSNNQSINHFKDKLLHDETGNIPYFSYSQQKKMKVIINSSSRNLCRQLLIQLILLCHKALLLYINALWIQILHQIHCKRSPQYVTNPSLSVENVRNLIKQQNILKTPPLTLMHSTSTPLQPYVLLKTTYTETKSWPKKECVESKIRPWLPHILTHLCLMWNTQIIGSRQSDLIQPPEHRQHSQNTNDDSSFFTSFIARYSILCANK